MTSNEEQRRIAHERLQSEGIRAALFASPFTLTWLTGFAPQVILGPEPTEGGPPLLWYREGEYTLIVSDREEQAARQSGLPVWSYSSMTVDQPLAGPQNLERELRAAIGSTSGFTGRAGVERQDLPVFLQQAAQDSLGTGADWVAIDGWFDLARAVKTAQEIERLRASFRLSDAGQAAARRMDITGQREIDVWSQVQAAVNRAAGERVPLGNNCVAARRAQGGGGFPGEEVLRPGDALLLDLGARKDGYWSGGTVTYYAGPPSREHERMHQAVRAALDLGISLLKPGVVCREIDRQVREAVQASGYPVYPHHTGHGIGVSGHEEPRIVPYNELRLAAGMVVMLEPAIYLPGQTGVRLEQGLLVTENGPELLSGHSL